MNKLKTRMKIILDTNSRHWQLIAPCRSDAVYISKPTFSKYMATTTSPTSRRIATAASRRQITSVLTSQTPLWCICDVLFIRAVHFPEI